MADRPARKRVVTIVRMKLRNLALVLIGAACLAMSASGQIIPGPFATIFSDSVTTFNGAPVPVGSLIQAFDPQGVICGQDTVRISGLYGFMPVYGDDPTTPSRDEGCVNGDLISFRINGRPATVTAGDPTYTAGGIVPVFKRAALAATGNIAMSFTDLPGPATDRPGDTFRFYFRVRNDGDVIDFYGVDVESFLGWNVTPYSGTDYIVPGARTWLYFDVEVPIWPGDLPDSLTFTVYSRIDPTVKITSWVHLFASITDVDDGDGSGLPGSFVLGQNYPNPFNPSTTIEFELPRASEVQFEVFDVLGRSVEQRNLGQLQAGGHRIEFEAPDLPSGVYLYRVSTAQGSKTHKMVLLK